MPALIYPGSAYPAGFYRYSFGTTPTVSKPTEQTTEKGKSVSFQVEATNTTEYKATGLPIGLSINSVNGKITGSVTTVESPTVTLKVKGPGGEAETTFVWKVVEELPTVVKPPPQTNTKGIALEFQVEATNTAEYKATGLPIGLSINAGTGKITGSPTTVEAPTVTLKVKSAAGGEAETTFVWTIKELAVGTVRFKLRGGKAAATVEAVKNSHGTIFIQLITTTYETSDPGEIWLLRNVFKALVEEV